MTRSVVSRLFSCGPRSISPPLHPHHHEVQHADHHREADQVVRPLLEHVDHRVRVFHQRGLVAEEADAEPGQRDPLIEYKKGSFEIFQEMMERIQDRVVKHLRKTEVVVEREGRRVHRPARAARHPPPMPKQQPMYFSGSAGAEPLMVKRKEAKVGACHGAVA